MKHVPLSILVLGTLSVVVLAIAAEPKATPGKKLILPASCLPSGKPDDGPPLRLAFITCCKDGPFYVPVRKGMTDAAQRMGVQSDWLGTDHVDIPAQAALVQKAVADGYHGIALSIIDPKAFDEVIAEAVKKGVPVVAFNVDDDKTPNARLSSVSQRFVEAGQALVKRIAADVPENAQVLVTLHDKGISALDERLQGIQEGLKAKKAKCTVLITGNDTAKGEKLIQETLEKNPDIRIVLGTGLADTEAAGRVIEKHFSGRGYWSAGFDLSEEILRMIKTDTIHCTIDQQPYIQGFYPVVQLTLYLRYGIQPSSMDAGAAIVDRSNADRVLELTRREYR